MIPVRLSLENFLCYRDNVPGLDFSGIHLACLCGSNGHGKSALLDAITWVLWGSARGKSQDELVHFGQSDMWVDLEFLARGERYRAIRRHSLSGLSGRRGASDLQLQIASDNGFNSITGNTIRETQAKIQQLIGMDYDTFINSAFLIQGRADEFTNKSAGDRKEVLAKILGLGIYDGLQERSRQTAREKERLADDIEATLGFMQDELGRRDQYQSELEQVEENLRVVSGKVSNKGVDVDAVRLQVQVLEQKTMAANSLQDALSPIEREISQLSEEIERQSLRIQDYRDTLKSQSSIEEGYQQYEQISSQYEKLNIDRIKFDTINQESSSLRQVIGHAKALLEERSRYLGQHLSEDLTPRAKIVSQLEQQIGEARRSAAAFSNDEDLLRQDTIKLHELAEQIGQMRSTQEQLKMEGEELGAKLALLSKSHKDARCPVCDTGLAEEDCLRLSQNYQAQIKAKRDTYKKNQLSLHQYQDQKELLEKELPERQVSLQQRQKHAQQHIFALERDLEESQRAANEVHKVTGELAELNKQLDEGQYAIKEQVSLQNLDHKIKELAYAAETHSELYLRIQDYQPYQRRREQLQEAIEKLPQEEEALSRTREMEERRRRELSETYTRLADMTRETKDLSGKRKELQSSESDLRYLQHEHQELLGRRGNLAGNLKSIDDLQRQSATKSKEMARLRDEQGVYVELSQAFSRQGVQALLIEAILPNIEEEANELLSRMTNGSMNVKLETQRELKSRRGEYAETLEIKISDELGPRNYEMFSGGEAFRINLALRIALSKVLAHRSGASLPTLFIDEGFGTQDTQGRERILEVIRAIESDFERIIVITHLDDLKEAFPVRIEVEKKDGASTCWIS